MIGELGSISPAAVPGRPAAKPNGSTSRSAAGPPGATRSRHRTLDVVSIGSNSVTFIDTATNAVKHITYIGRSPHEAFFTQDGKEVWVTEMGAWRYAEAGAVIMIEEAIAAR